MNRRKTACTACVLLAASHAALAHTPVLSCYDNGDGRVTCEAGFSDGTSAAGASVRIVDEMDRVILQGTFDQSATFTFAKPGLDYYVVFDADSNHVVVLFSGEIE